MHVAIVKNISDNDVSLHVPRPDGPGDQLGVTFQDVFPYIMAVFAVVEYTLMAVMVFGNMVILASFAIRKMRGSHCAQLSPSGRLVLNLALADMLVGLGLCYFSVFKFWPALAARLARYRVPCLLRFSICFFTMFGSHCALLVVALDRYTAIVHTLHYKDYMTTRVSWCLVAVGWLAPMAGAAALFGINQWRPEVPSCDEHHVVPHFLLALGLPSNVFVLVTISVTHWRVHKEVKAYSRRCADPDFVARPAAAAARRVPSRGSRKSAHVLLQVTGTFILCWTPLDVMLVLLVVAPPHPVLLLLFECAFLLAMTSFLLNPFIYAWKTEATRRPLVSLLVRLGVLRMRSEEGDRANRAGNAAGRVFTISVSANNSSSSASGGSASSNQTANTNAD